MSMPSPTPTLDEWVKRFVRVQAWKYDGGYGGGLYFTTEDEGENHDYKCVCLGWFDVERKLLDQLHSYTDKTGKQTWKEMYFE